MVQGKVKQHNYLQKPQQQLISTLPVLEARHTTLASAAAF